MHMGALIILVFILGTGTFFLMMSTLQRKKLIRKRIDHHIPQDKRNNEEMKEEKKVKRSSRIISASGQIFKGIQFSKKTEQLLLQAGSSMKMEEFFVYRLLTAFLLGCLFVMVGFQWILCTIGFFIGFALPKMYMSYKRKKRLNLLPLQLIDTLGMMSNSMRAGFSFMQVMQLVGKEMPDPIGPEFERAVREAGLGIPLEEVFEDMLKRLPSKELEVALQAIIAQRKSGGNLAELLETMEDTIRGRVRILGELKTLTSQGKLSSWIITLLPIGLGLYLNFIDPEYFSPLITHPIGIVMIVIAGLFILIGWFVIQKILRIEV